MSFKKSGADRDDTAGRPGTVATDFAVGASEAQALARAVSFHIEGKTREALREIDAAVDRGEDSPELHSARGHLQFELEQYEEAVRSYSRVLALEQQYPATHYNLGVCLEKIGRAHV
jgi:Flp pilus assembly protein TadD